MHTGSTNRHCYTQPGVVCASQETCFCCSSPDAAPSDDGAPDPAQAIYAEFDDDFEDEELSAPIGKCTAMYNFPGMTQTLEHHRIKTK